MLRVKHNPTILGSFGSVYLDAVRAVAALLVVFGHVVGLFFVVDPAHHTVVSKLYYSIGARSHDAVLAFFVLSGLLIGKSAASVVLAQNESWLEYAVARASRLYVVLLPALLIGGLWDMAGLSLFGISYGTALIPVSVRLDFGHFFASFFFLQEIVLPPFGSNQPLWSLAYEAWYYAMFPLLLLLILKRRTLRSSVFLALLLALCCSVIGTKNQRLFSDLADGSSTLFPAADAAGYASLEHCFSRQFLSQHSGSNLCGAQMAFC